jgi:diadenosine tetraphosphate (Ap4A) HIT family hydrolase
MKNCPFCNAPPSSRWLESECAVALWDGYPISEGHTLVVPRLHVASLFDLPPTEIASVWAFVSRVRGELAKRFLVESFTIGLNDGQSAGQTVMHAHVHVVPRREGDVPDPRGGIRWVIQGKADYWTRSP